MSDIGASVATGGITAALIALIYTGIQILKRSRCHSNSACCEFEVDREAELQKKITQRDELVAVIVKTLKGIKDEEVGGEEGEGEL